MIKYTTEEKEKRAKRVMRNLAAQIAKDVRRTMRSYHLLVDGCAGMDWKLPDGHNECERCGIVIHFSTEDAYGWLTTLIQPQPITAQLPNLPLLMHDAYDAPMESEGS